MRKIINSDSQQVSDETEIGQKLKQFYSSLYKRHSNKPVDECMSYLANMNIPRLTDEEQSSCEGKLTENECWITLSSTGNKGARGTMVCLKSFIFVFFMEFVTIFQSH